MKETRKGVCPFCRLGCELGVVTEGWHVRGVEYLGESSPNSGSLCARGNTAAIYLDHPRRLVFPVLNRKEIDWGQAFGELTDIVKKTDPRELAITYDSNLTEEEYSLIWGLAEKLGVENLASSYLEPEYYFAHVLNGLPRASSIRPR
jgi:anaerobic selenocysteine-containing dehydrogenase